MSSGSEQQVPTDALRPTAPYVPFSTFETGLNLLKSHGLPSRIDSSVFKSMSGSAQNQLLAAFRFLGVTDESGKPSQEMQRLVDDETRNETIGRLLREKYRDLLAINLEKASPKQFEEAIRLYNVQGEQLRKAKSFFLKCAQAAEIPLSSHLTLKTRASVSRKRTASKKNGASTKPPAEQEVITIEVPKGSDVKRIKLPEVGGELTLTGTFNALKLRGAERDLVFKIVDLMNDYEALSDDDADGGADDE